MGQAIFVKLCEQHGGEKNNEEKISSSVGIERP